MRNQTVYVNPRKWSRFAGLCLFATAIGACSSSEDGSGTSLRATGGLPNGTNVRGGGSGGVAGVGGVPASSGGVSSAATTYAQGSSNALGGLGSTTPSTGGATRSASSSLATGGTVGLGGNLSSGGTVARGGAFSAGGDSVGGAPRGGTSTAGGTNGTGGLTGGGTVGKGGASGGKSSTGGSVATGGGAGTTAYAPCPTNGTACKILPFGDSITYGMQSSDKGGYRSQLFKLIVDAGQKATFTGSQSDGPATVSGVAFPKNHEGHSGWTIDPGYSSYGAGGISSLVPSPAFSSIPNIVLMMIGTNDVYASSGQSTISNRLESLLDKVIQTAPNALIVLATLTPLSSTNATLTAYNAKIPAIVQSRDAKGQHIVLVDMGRMPTSNLSDGVHPNDQGYAYMANVWYAAIKDFLPKN